MRRRPVAWAIAVALLGAGWAQVLAERHLTGAPGPLDRAEAALTDLRMVVSGPVAFATPVTIVAIDDATLAADPGGFPLDRARLAELIERIADAGATALALDILLLDETEADAQLAAALRRLPSVIAAAGAFQEGDATPTGIPRSSSAFWPAEIFADSARQGLVNIVTDASGTPRHIPLVAVTDRGIQTSLVLTAAALWSGQSARLSDQAVSIGSVARPLDLGAHLPLRIAGPPGTIPTLSAQALLDRELDRDVLQGRLVLVGFTATAVGDDFITPFDSFTPGVEILASGIATLVGGPGLARTPAIRRTDAVVSTILASGGAALVLLAPLSFGLPAALAVLAGWEIATGVLLGRGLWLNAALPLAASLPPIALAAIARHLMERRAALASQGAVTALRRFHAPLIADRIAHDPDFLAKPVSCEIAILFLDLADFTSLSERIGPARTRDYLKDLHSRATEEIEFQGGLVLNYIGDGVMATFGLPDPRHDDAERALRAAMLLVPAIGSMSLPGGGTGQGCRVGLHFGEVIASRLGHDRQQQVTVAGDAVNLASRLMDTAKSGSAVIAASSDLMDRVNRSRFPPADSEGTVPVRGRAVEVTVSLWRTIPPPA